MSATHGMYGTPTYKSWQAMKGRCSGRLSDARYYKEAGVKLCEQWKSFAAFYADMGIKPEGMTLDRIDSTKGYEPANCRWATKVEQMKNRRNTVWHTLNGITLSQAEWQEFTGLKRGAIETRLKLGWPIEDVLNPLKNFRYVKNGKLKTTQKYADSLKPQPQTETA